MPDRNTRRTVQPERTRRTAGPAHAKRPTDSYSRPGREIQMYSAREIRRNRIILCVVVIVVLVGVFFGLRACVGGITSAPPQSASSSSAAATQGMQSVSDAAGPASSSASAQTASAKADTQANASQANSGEPEELRWRDSDFAVDPARTDWNYNSNGRKVVYLTIDDGPSENTRAVLDILDKYGCKATFFVVGHDPDCYPLIREAYNRGNTIGLHTFTHDYAYVYSSKDAYFEDLDRIGQVVKDQIGFVPCFIRFPGGSSNSISSNYTEGIMTALTGEVQARGYQYYDWNMSSGDGSDHTADELVQFSTEPTEYDNIVLLVHDSPTKQTTVEALPRIIEHYQSLGYSFEALDRSSMVPHHGVAN